MEYYYIISDCIVALGQLKFTTTHLIYLALKCFDKWFITSKVLWQIGRIFHNFEKKKGSNICGFWELASRQHLKKHIFQ